jgi:subtilisin family serine protease
MAAPHVAGAAALYLESHPAASPAEVAQALVANATNGRLQGLGTGSPNLLLFTGLPGTNGPAPKPCESNQPWSQKCK